MEEVEETTAGKAAGTLPANPSMNTV